MMRNYFILFILLAFVFDSCTKPIKDETCESFDISPVTNVAGPATAQVNQEVPITVSFTAFNGCGNFLKFEEQSSAGISTIKVHAKYLGCICTMDLPTRQVIYTFKRDQAGTYTLRFFQSHGSYLDHVIVVQ